jgi:transcriptional regulator with XRE-family HTH domain
MSFGRNLQAMATQGSPAVARHRLRLALRRRREATGRTQGDIAKSLDWSLSKLQRIEAGENSISTTDLQALLGQLKVTDPAVISTLVAQAKAARGRSRWDQPRYRDQLTPATKALLDFEAVAVSIRNFQMMYIPGILQTPEVAAAMLHPWIAEVSDFDHAARLEVRLQRRAYVLERPDRPTYQLVLDESVLHRDVGGPTIYANQLRHLLGQSRQGLIQLRIAPFKVVPRIALNFPFTVLTMDTDEEEDSVVYRENQQADEIIQAPDRVHRHLHAFDQLWQQSFSQDASERLIEARASYLLASLDRGSTTSPDR